MRPVTDIDNRPEFDELRNELPNDHVLGIITPDELPKIMVPGSVWLTDHAKRIEDGYGATGPNASYAVKLRIERREQHEAGLSVEGCYVSDDCDYDAVADLIAYYRDRVHRYGIHPNPDVNKLTI